MQRTRPGNDWSENGVCRPWLRSAAGVTCHVRSGSITQTSATPPTASRPTLAASVPIALPSTAAGPLVSTASVRSQSGLSRDSSSSAACRRQASAALASSSSPVAPGCASANGSVFSSRLTGVWSDTSASIVPSCSAVRSAARSAAWRSGGASAKRVSNQPMSASVKCNELMLTSQLTGSPSALACRTSATPAALLSRHRCTAAPVDRISSNIVCSAIVSAATGTLLKPSRVATAPPAATPRPRYASTGRSQTR